MKGNDSINDHHGKNNLIQKIYKINSEIQIINWLTFQWPFMAELPMAMVITNGFLYKRERLDKKLLIWRNSKKCFFLCSLRITLRSWWSQIANIKRRKTPITCLWSIKTPWRFGSQKCVRTFLPDWMNVGLPIIQNVFPLPTDRI